MARVRKAEGQAKILRLGHLYPALMNIYGDRGNILTLQRRCHLRGIELDVVPLEIGTALAPGDFDILFMGGAQDNEQRLVAEDLAATKAALRDAVEDGAVFLGVCGGYQLSGRFYRGLDGKELPGAGVFDLIEDELRNMISGTSGWGVTKNLNINCYPDEHPLILQGCMMTSLLHLDTQIFAPGDTKEAPLKRAI